MQTPTRSLGAAVVAAFFVLFQMHAPRSFAQAGSRIMGADAFALDDHGNHLYTLLPPSGLSANYTYVFPSPPSIAGLTPAFIAKATTAGQIAVWDGSEWVWGNAVTTTWMNNPPSAPFAFTFNATAGPASSGQLDLGDASHHFRRMYVDSIIGANVGTGAGLGPVLSGDASGPQSSTSVIALRGVGVSTTAPTASQALVYSGSQWTPSNVVNAITAGTGMQSSAPTGSVTLSITNIPVANGGTGATTASGAINNLLPTQSGNAGKILQTDGSNVSWQSVSGGGVTSVALSAGTTGLTTSGGPITTSGTITLAGTLAVTNGGTGATSATAAINNLLPTQSGNATKVLQTDGTNVSWQSVGGGGGTGWALTGNAAGATDVLGTTNAQDLVIETSGTERMRIYSSGNVQLTRTGASAPQLQLQGTGTGVTTLSAGAQGSTTISYVLPTAQGAASSTLSNDGSGNLSWTNVGQTKFARKTANTDVTAAALGNDPHLVISVGANETYAFEAFLSLSDPNAGGTTYKFAFTAPTGSTIKWGYNDATSAAGAANTIVNTSGTPTRQMGLNNASEVFLFVKGILITGSNSGSLQFQTMKVGGGLPTDPVRFNANSYLQAVRVN